MRENYFVRIADASGNHLVEFANFGSRQGAALDYVLNVGKPSVARMSVPDVFDLAYFPLDARMTVWRSVGGQGPFHEGNAAYLIRKWNLTETETTLTGWHANSLFGRRVVAYGKSSAFADKAAAAADSLIRTLWNENAGSSINSSRDGAETYADISAYVTNPSTTAAGQSVAIQASRKGLDDVVTELCESSTTSGTYLAAEILAAAGSKLELRTFPGVRGRDRRVVSNVPLVFSKEMGTLVDIELVVDRSEEKTVVIAVGAGDDDLRLVQVAIDAERIAASPLNRIEWVVQLSNISDDAQLLAAANAELRLHRPVTYLKGKIPEGSPLTRGLDYDFGDLVTAEFRGQRYDCRIDSIRGSIGHANRTTQVVLRSMT